MKNITVTLDDELYHAARVEAARQKTNVTAVVRNYLAAFAIGKTPNLAAELDEDRKHRDALTRLFEEANLVLGYTPSRSRTYER